MENNLVNYYSLFQLDRAETTAALYGKLEDLMKRAQMDNTFEDSDVVRRQQIKQAMEIFSYAMVFMNQEHGSMVK